MAASLAGSACGPGQPECGGPVVTARGSPAAASGPGRSVQPWAGAPGARGTLQAGLVCPKNGDSVGKGGHPRAPDGPRPAAVTSRFGVTSTQLAALAMAAEDESAPKVPLAAAVRSNPDPQRASSLTRSIPTALPQCPWHASVQCPRPVKSTFKFHVGAGTESQERHWTVFWAVQSR